MNLLQPRLWSYWTDVGTHPARLDDLVVPGEAVLNVHQLLEVILKTNKHVREVRMFSRKCNVELLHCGIRSYPLFHDVVSVVRHFFYDAEGSCVDRKRLNYHFSSLRNTTHNR